MRLPARAALYTNTTLGPSAATRVLIYSMGCRFPCTTLPLPLSS